jgi:hypothetical protein
MLTSSGHTSDTLNPIAPEVMKSKMDTLLLNLQEREVAYEADIEDLEDKKIILEGRLTETRTLIAELRNTLGL